MYGYGAMNVYAYGHKSICKVYSNTVWYDLMCVMCVCVCIYRVVMANRRCMLISIST